MAKRERKNKSNGKTIGAGIALAGAVALFGSVMWSTFAEDEYYDDEYASVDNTGAAVGPIQSTSIVTPNMEKPRQLQAPNYNDLLASAQIIKQAFDQTEAQKFVALRTSIRNMKMLEKLSEMQAQHAENELRAKQASTKLVKISEGVQVDSGLDGLEPAYGEQVDYGGAPTVGMYGEQVGTHKAQQLNLRLTGFAGVSRNRVIMSLGSEEAANVRVGQTVFGRYRITKIDTELSCVSLFDDKEKSAIPAVCYQG